MKYIISTSFFLIVNLSICFSQTQGELNETACDSYQKADKKLNEIYQKVLKEYALDTIFIKKFKTAQRQWVRLRDADIEARFLPGEFYGTIEPMCRCAILQDMTNDRVKYISLWIEGLEDQEGCKGTVKEKE